MQVLSILSVVNVFLSGCYAVPKYSEYFDCVTMWLLGWCYAFTKV